MRVGWIGKNLWYVWADIGVFGWFCGWFLGTPEGVLGVFLGGGNGVENWGFGGNIFPSYFSVSLQKNHLWGLEKSAPGLVVYSTPHRRKNPEKCLF